LAKIVFWIIHLGWVHPKCAHLTFCLLDQSSPTFRPTTE